MQAQGYWAQANRQLFELTGDERYRERAIASAHAVLHRQRPDGAWDYPNPEWKGRVATVEVIWGSIALLEGYRLGAWSRPEPVLLDGARRAHRFILDVVGFQRVGDELAVNYFAAHARGRVPNNSASLLRFLAELARAEDTPVAAAGILDLAPDLLRFLMAAQLPSGELPYSIGGPTTDESRAHFQCYQYNAFQCLALLRYDQLVDDAAARGLIAAIARYLGGALAADGHARYDCRNRYRVVHYHAAAVGAALVSAASCNAGDTADLGDRAYEHVLSQQASDGSFPFSRGDYRLLSDNRSYPRYEAMILHHLLLRQTTSRAEGQEIR